MARQWTVTLWVALAAASCYHAPTAQAAPWDLLFRSRSHQSAPEPSAKIPWLRDLNQGLQAAQSRQRPMLLFLSMDGCGYCQKMKGTTFTDGRVQRVIRDGYIPVSVKASEQPKLMRRLQIQSFPTTLIVSPQGKIVGNVRGYLPPSAFLTRIEPVQYQARYQASNSVTTRP